MIKKMKSLGLFVVGLLVAAPVLAARPVKQPTPAVPVIVDAAGSIVGPVVPVADGTMALAAVHRANGERIKILFDAFTSSAGTGETTALSISATSQLRLRGPVSLWFPDSLDCTGAGYVQDVDFLKPDGASFIWNQVITKEYKGYSVLFAYPKAPQPSSAGVRIVRVDWTQPTYAYSGLSASRLGRDGVCTSPSSVTSISLAGALLPVTFEAELNFTGPYRVE